MIILDFGGQYTHLIARRCRELRVYSEIFPADADARAVLESGKARAIILSGGPRSVYEEGAPLLDPKILDMGLPVLGICYGHQLIGAMLGGDVRRGEKAEYGRTNVLRVDESELLKGLPERFGVWMSHGDAVIRSPPGFRVTAKSESNIVAAMESPSAKIFSVQFHPEVYHTEHGKLIINNFLRGIARIEEEWVATDRIDEMIREVQTTVGDEGRVLCAVSGGIDSLTTAAIVHRAVGDRLYVVFIDHGLLRKNERDEVLRTLKRLGVSNVIHVDASEEFLNSLKGVKDAEAKRQVIGRVFIEVLERTARTIEGCHFLAQGTIYPDRVESGVTGRYTSKIKSHHNVGGLPERLNLRLVEPLRDLYKDEVRAVARKLGIPEDIVNRHPFPGPGLAVRIVGEVTEDRLRICREANAIVEEEVKREGIYNELWQAFAVVIDARWVGVKGDAREEGYIVIIRAVTSEDGMTADAYPMRLETLYRINKRITDEVEGVVMVSYALTSKPPSTIEAC